MNITRDDFREVNRLTIPVLSSSFVELLFSIADQAIIGRTNVTGYAAVGVASNLIYVLTGTFGILSLAFSILFGKAVGKDKKDEAEEIFQTTMTVAIIIGIVFGGFCALAGKAFLSRLYGLQGEMLEYAFDYLKIAGWGLGLNTIIFIFSAYFKNLKRTEIHFYATVVSFLINFIIDYTLVFGKLGFPRLGVKGAAIGTVTGLVVYLGIYIWQYKKINFLTYKCFISRKCLSRIAKLYVPLLGQDFIEGTLFVLLITAIITRFNVYLVAAYNLLEAVSGMISLPIFAYAGTALMLVTQNTESMEKIKKYCTVIFLCSLVAVGVIGGLFTAFPELVGAVITSDVKLIETVRELFWLLLPVQILNIANQLFKYCLQGVSKEGWVLGFSTTVSAAACVVIYILADVYKLGVVGVYAGMALEYFVLGIGYFWKFFKNIGMNRNFLEKLEVKE